MAKRPTSKPAAKKSTPVVTKKSEPLATTAVRNTPIPKPTKAAKPLAAAAAVAAPVVVTQDQIAKRAYEIWQSGTGGSESDNWHRAERELRGV